uniref:Fe2OG dioxygenase domain-containing protein n=1 Tax=Spumella elongata TaxID=89044 RepID=A0A7S3H020_9STRA|mmetsp:Transcript_28091/g.48086  ORF Transcript_28091/g.48086 Transcript_28091/m.48086 type:complete len:470 (+) Transcript_28091:52-1461(+)
MSVSQCACCPVDVDPPKGYTMETVPTLVNEDQVWSDEKHLSLTFPTSIQTLEKDLNNDPEVVKFLATDYGCCSRFRVMSNEGSRVLDHVIDSLEKYSKSCPRIPKLIRGATFRSEFLNGMGHSSAVLRHVSLLAGCELIYHPMKIHQLHVNMKPNDSSTSTNNPVKKNVDRWHCDSTPFVLIVFCTDPDEYTGGTLQFFNGPKEEGLRILTAGNGLPADRVKNVGRQDKGFGVFMQGWRVFHQVTPVLTGDARTTMVFSFYPRNVLALEACAHLSQTYAPVDPLYIIMPDWVRFRAWKAARRLEMLREKWDDFTLASKNFTDNDLITLIDTTHAKLWRIVKSLPYTDQRQLFTSCLRESIEDLKTFLLATYPDKISCAHLLSAKEPALDTENIDPATSGLTLSVTSVADLEDTEVGVFGKKQPLLFGLDAEFLCSPLGVSNLMGVVEDIENCVDDVITLQEEESKLVYF